MSSDENSLLSFLDFILTRIHVETSLRISKNGLIKNLKDFLALSEGAEDPEIVFEDWGSLLRKPFFLGNHLIHYSIYTDTLTLEVVPTLQQMNRAAETYSSNLHDLVVKEIERITFKEFEQLMAEVFRKVPWIEKVNSTQLTRDEGIDFEGIYKDSKSGLRLSLFGQAKHWIAKVGSDTVSTFVGSISLKTKEPSIGILVSTGGYTDDANSAIRKSPIKLLSYDKRSLAALMIEYEIGVKSFRIEGKMVDDPFWKDIKE
jgi:restriction endonuclease Mrr